MPLHTCLHCRIIAVSYEARALGVKRSHSGNQAQEVCPSIHLFRVPERRGKADLTRYRESSQEVFDILLSYTSKLERASVDEAFVDITDLVELRMKELTISDCLSVLKGNTMVPHYGPTPSAATAHDEGIAKDKNDVAKSEDVVAMGKESVAKCKLRVGSHGGAHTHTHAHIDVYTLVQ